MAAQRDVYVRMRVAFTFAVALLEFGSSGNASNRRCLPSFVAAVGQFRLMPQMWCGLGADAWFENMSVYVNLLFVLALPLIVLELHLLCDFPSTKLFLLCSLRVSTTWVSQALPSNTDSSTEETYLADYSRI